MLNVPKNGGRSKRKAIRTLRSNVKGIKLKKYKNIVIIRIQIQEAERKSKETEEKEKAINTLPCCS
jgi:hypothetical protein